MQDKIPVIDNKERGIRTRFVGTKELMDPKTGEMYIVQVAEKKVGHRLKRGWRRVYMEQFMEIFTGLYSQGRKIEVVEYILDNLNSENQLIKTQQQVTKGSGASSKTVVETYKYLVKIGFMAKTGAVYTVNPHFVCAYGSDQKNANILIKFSEAEATLFDETDQDNAEEAQTA